MSELVASSGLTSYSTTIVDHISSCHISGSAVYSLIIVYSSGSAALRVLLFTGMSLMFCLYYYIS
jgi:hypothetical protein